jgi:hypothetical protein
MGARLGGFVYGTIIALSVIVAGARAFPEEAGHISALVAATSVTFWLAHVYAHGLAHAVSLGEHLSLSALGDIARREGAIVEAAVPPLGALLLGALGIVSTEVALWTAFGLGLTVLAVQGFVFAHVEGLGRLGTLGVVAANLGLGAVLVGLKLVLSH